MICSSSEFSIECGSIPRACVLMEMIVIAATRNVTYTSLRI